MVNNPLLTKEELEFQSILLTYTRYKLNHWIESAARSYWNYLNYWPTLKSISKIINTSRNWNRLTWRCSEETLSKMLSNHIWCVAKKKSSEKKIHFILIFVCLLVLFGRREASQVALVVKNPLASARDIKTHSIFKMGRRYKQTHCYKRYIHVK